MIQNKVHFYCILFKNHEMATSQFFVRFTIYNILLATETCIYTTYKIIRTAKCFIRIFTAFYKLLPHYKQRHLSKELAKHLPTSSHKTKYIWQPPPTFLLS